MKKFIIACLLSIVSGPLFSQGYVDQDAVYSLSESQQGTVDNVVPVRWLQYTYTSYQELLQYIDSLPGSRTELRRYVVELANRVTFDNLKRGQTLILPASFEADYRAYAPYPFFYTAAAQLPKLFIIDKFTQTFAAYEYGKLVRWGLVSTGRKNNLTPAGRYNFNWKQYYRLSNAAPPGEVWEMYWVYDFHAKFGIHVHQYALPINRPASHGCVRTSLADAKWNYNWANGWVYDKKGKLLRNGTPVMVINQNPKGSAAHWRIERNEVATLVHLPLSVDSVKPGTIAQRLAPWNSGW